MDKGVGSLKCHKEVCTTLDANMEANHFLAEFQAKTGITTNTIKISGTVASCSCGAASDEHSVTFKFTSAQEVREPKNLPSNVEDPSIIKESDPKTGSSNSGYTSKVLGINQEIKPYEIKEINSLNSDKKLLAIPWDGILDSFSQEHYYMREFLHDFMCRLSPHYNIAIWSSMDMEPLEQKLSLLNILSNENHPIVFCLDKEALATNPQTSTDEAKLLTLIWKKYSAFSSKNTVIVSCQDSSNASTNNEKSVVRIKRLNGVNDQEMIELEKYLEAMAELTDFSTNDHTKWGSSTTVRMFRFCGEETYFYWTFVEPGPCNIQRTAPIIPKKKLLIFNLDSVMFSPRLNNVVRSFMQIVLTRAYQHYNIAIWSWENRHFMKERAEVLGFNDHPQFNVSFYINYHPGAIPPIKEVRLQVLKAVSAMYPQFSIKNTAIMDGQRLGIRHLIEKRSIRTEFMKFASYLIWAVEAAPMKFEDLPHNNWHNWNDAVGYLHR